MADSTNRIAGVAYVTVDGQRVALAGKGTYRLSQENRETLIGQDGVHGYKGMPAAGAIKWTLRDSGAPIQALLDATNATVVLELANGKTIIGRNMWRTGEPSEVDSEEATAELEYEGLSVTEA